MSSKVSIISACYNKAPYIGRMLESIQNQSWENIEVILVNDGSTDGTREVIAEWELKLRNRGYEVVILDQENSGVAASIKKGLAHASGDYVCFPDCDDKLSRDYVSEMARILDGDQSVDFVICDLYIKSEEGRPSTAVNFQLDFDKGKALERFLLREFISSVCIYLFRLSYLHKVGLPESILVLPRRTQEPQILIPVFSGGGKFIKLDKVLYVYNTHASSLAAVNFKNPLEKTTGEYNEIQMKTIAKLPVSEERKIELYSIARTGNLFLCNQVLGRVCIDEVFFRAIAKKILEETDVVEADTSKRIIAYGSLGVNAKRILPSVKGTPLWPTLFWDKAAKNNSVAVDGSKVTVIQPELLTPNDIILCLPEIQEVVEEAQALADVSGVSVMRYREAVDWLANWYYPKV